MTFTDFFKTINDTKIFDCTREGLVINICQAAGSVDGISPEVVKQWFKRKNMAQPTTYFPQYKVDKAGFIKYFKDNTADTWQILLEAFRKLEDTGVVDCNPADDLAFYLSLLKQFYEILGFPWIESPKERMLGIFNQAVKNHNILDFLQNDSISRILMDLVDDVCAFVSEIKTKLYEFRDSNEPVLGKIIDFTILIDEYNEFLGQYMLPRDDSEFYFLLPQTNRLVFQEEITSRVQNLEVLYNEIQSMQQE
ncbi:MAG: hypothetical protein HFI90_05650 [Clostridia bacterium]|nr:hypothetical protein [Clostridia bacterium]